MSYNYEREYRCHEASNKSHDILISEPIWRIPEKCMREGIIVATVTSCVALLTITNERNKRILSLLPDAQADGKHWVSTQRLAGYSLRRHTNQVI